MVTIGLTEGGLGTAGGGMRSAGSSIGRGVSCGGDPPQLYITK